jgi:hypothetical protein
MKMTDEYFKTIWYVPENNHGCRGHVVKIKTTDGENFEIVSESNCCAQSGSVHYEIGQKVKLPKSLWIGIIDQKDNYGNTFLEPSDLLQNPEGGFADVMLHHNVWCNEKYEEELERYNKKIGMRWE